ncbi:MAG: extracellular solute-binding protein [Pseudomonadota bacterium]
MNRRATHPILMILLAFGCAVLAGCTAEEAQQAPQRADAGIVNLYSARHYENDEKIYAQFTAETGITVNKIQGRGDALIERLASEGAASPADLFLTADAGILWRAQTRGILRPLRDEALESAVPAAFRHPDGLWYGLTKRARIIIYNRELGLPASLATYADLADPAYKGMVCVRPSSNIYNQSLLASIIAHKGAAAAEAWARGVVANFARKPQGNDTAQIEAVAAGLCRVAIVNSYYVARFVDPASPNKESIGDKIGVLFPDQGANRRGAHVNISGGGLAMHATNIENARAFLRFLVREDIQASFAAGNNEYPIRSDVAPQGPVASFGAFTEDQLPVTALGENQREAVAIFERAGWL